MKLLHEMNIKDSDWEEAVDYCIAVRAWATILYVTEGIQYTAWKHALLWVNLGRTFSTWMQWKTKPPLKGNFNLTRIYFDVGGDI